MKRFPLLLCLLSALLLCLGKAEAKMSINQQIGQGEKELKKITAELSTLTEELGLLTQKEETNLKLLEVINKRLEMYDQELLGYDANLKQIAEETVLTEEKVTVLRARTEHQRENLRSRLRALYKQSSISDLELFFTSKGIKNFLKNKKYLELLSKKDMERIDEFGHSIDELNILQLQLAEEKAKIEQIKALSLAKRDEILSEKQNKKVAIEEIKKEKDYYFAKKRDLENAEKRVTDLIASLTKEKAATKEERLDFKDFASIKGRMPWPIEGKVITHFGKEKNEVFDTYLYHNGIEIVSKEDIPVRSVFKGKVLFVGPFENFGNMVVLSHGNGYYTLYAYLQESLVKMGDVVESGEKIASVGKNAKIVKPTLYFEIRKKGEAIDPEKWLSN